MRTNFKKWISIIGIPLLFVAIIIVVLYNSAQKPYEKAEKEAVRQLQENASLSHIADVYIYHSTTTYYTGTGQDESGKNIAVWLAQDRKSKPVTLPLEQGVTEKEARALFKKEAGKADILSLALGMEGKTPVWLFTFKDNNGRLNYYYLTFSNGTWWKKVENI